MTDRTLRTAEDLDALAFDERGLVPVVAQDASDGRVLMVAWADRPALERTLGSGFMHYWSRSRRELWKKGETSGNVQRVVSLHADCDADTVLALVDPAGPACHTGEATCFGESADMRAAETGQEPTPTPTPTPAPAPAPAPAPDTDRILMELWAVLRKRAHERPEGSYTTRLLDDENLRLKKLGEETAELITALARRDDRASEEAADLLYHVMVALLGAGGDWSDVLEELAQRRG